MNVADTYNMESRRVEEHKKSPFTSDLSPGYSTKIKLIDSMITSKSAPHLLLKRESRNNTSDKHLNTIHMHKLLTFGWLRQQCQSDADAIIPSGVLDTCFEFIYIERLLFCLVGSHSIQAVDIHNTTTQYETPPDLNVPLDANGICIYSDADITFPKNITAKFDLRPHRESYHTLFKCGSSSSRDTRAIIIPQNQFMSRPCPSEYSNEVIRAFEWVLPDMPSDVSSYGNATSYSATHGLISIGGTQPNTFLGAGSHTGVFQLDWGECDNDEVMAWKTLHRMNTGRAYASSTFITDDSGIEHLLVCGGDLNGSVEVYNFGNNQWSDVSNTNVSRECAGIFYDKFDQRVYLGGGHGAQKKVECYDICKDEWTIFPATECNHDFYPALFTTSFHFDVLYIVSPKSNLAEYIDKREGKKWSILFDNEMHDKMFKVADSVEFEQFRFLN